MVGKNKHTDLTDQQFWNSYWEKLKIPSFINQEFSFDRCLSQGISKGLNGLPFNQKNARKISVLEIGAAPGKWLSLFPADRYSVSGLESNPLGIEALRKNLKMLGIVPLRVIEGNFFEVRPLPSFDIVLSLGFVEHFTNPMLIIQRHLKWLNSNGVLIIGVPNFTGLHGFLQRMLDPKVLAKHNTSIMNKSFFDEVGKLLKIKQLSCDYLGSFEPALPMTYHQISITNIIPKIVLRGASYIRKWRFWDRLNSPFFSSYILTFYRKIG